MTALIATLEQILKGRTAAKCETETLDFKQAKTNLKEAQVDLADAAVCFANSSGGTIVVGVADDKAGQTAFLGCDMDATQLRAKIHSLTSPSLLVEVSELNFANARLLVISVPEGIEVYSTTKGYTYHRINTDCIPMRPADVTRLSEERRGFDWSATPSGRTLEDIDPFALMYCRWVLAGSVDVSGQRLANLNDIDLLSALNVISENG